MPQTSGQGYARRTLSPCKPDKYEEAQEAGLGLLLRKGSPGSVSVLLMMM